MFASTAKTWNSHSDVAGNDQAAFPLGYKPYLDGLRGVCILGVIAVHALLPDIRARGVGAAFVGVNTFFVLSGFLITTLLLREWDQFGKIDLKRFYARRALRLLPALCLLITFFVCEAAFFGSPGAGTATFCDALFPALYISNWSRALGFDRPVLFAHTWSLSIEEQFYILWPVSLILLMKFTRSRSSLIHVLGLIIFVLGVERILMIAAGATPERIFNGTDTRADALLLGCMCGVLLATGWRPSTNLSRRSLLLASWLASLSLILLSLFNVYMYHFAEQSLYFVCSVSAGTTIAGLVCFETGFIARILSTPVLVFIGRISYGLYLWHAPVFMRVFEHGMSRTCEVLVGLALTFVAALSSYYRLERPFLQLKTKFSHLR